MAQDLVEIDVFMGAPDGQRHGGLVGMSLEWFMELYPCDCHARSECDDHLDEEAL
jgi:hypothetical protein